MKNTSRDSFFYQKLLAIEDAVSNRSNSDSQYEMNFVSGAINYTAAQVAIGRLLRKTHKMAAKTAVWLSDEMIKDMAPESMATMVCSQLDDGYDYLMRQEIEAW